MAKKILFWPDVYLEQGHWLPTLVWAKGLKAQLEQNDDPNAVPKSKYEVAYMGIEDCRSVVSPFGYVEEPSPNDKGHFYPIFPKLYPLGYTRENHGSIAERWKTDHVFAIAAGELGCIFDDAAKRPDLLVSGYFTSLESLMIHYMYDIPIVITTTFLRHPQEDPAIRALQNLTAFPREVARKLMKQAMRDKWDDGIEIEDFVKPLEGFDELIPCPREFEFSHYRSGAKVHYSEPCITDESSDGGRLSEFWSSIPQSKPADGGNAAVQMKYIFATAGSQVQDYEERAEGMFRQMVRMMDEPQMRDYYLILAAGPKLSQKTDWGGTAGRYKVVGWAPQRSILEHPDTKAALIHGGLATLKECVYYNVPFVVLPLGKDQLDNSLRVRELNLGEVAYPDSIRSTRLLQSVSRVLNDRWMGLERGRMSAVFKKAETASPPSGLKVLLDLLDALPPEEQSP